MNVVALVSGGKDSCYSILRARQHGHHVIALAHITPPPSISEPDSFMYQSVASSAVSTLAAALELPLHTSQTSARAVSTGMSYSPTPGDEVEDLALLLKTVKESHPELDAVCAGALWSDYQRLRVESAASRAGLLSLAYLWRREQSGLLDEMIAVGVDAVLVKVAGIGLGDEHLGKTLAEMRPTLTKLHERYGSHVCGEGGEFESFVRWMPGMNKRVVLDEVESVLHSDDPVAPVSYLKIAKCHLEEPTPEQLAIPEPVTVEIPVPFRTDLTAEELNGTQVKGGIVRSVHNEEVLAACTFEKTSVGTSGKFMHVVVRHPLEGRKGVTEAAKRLEAILKANGEGLGSVVYVLLHLRAVSGEKYKDANRGYSDVFGIPECTPPPSRACVGAFRNNHPTVLEALVRKQRNREESDSFTLHVQSLSEWAPPCIGPYAQFVEEDGLIHVCGVLPLYAPLANIPENMSIRSQVEACACNLRRTLEASRASIDKLGLFVAYVISPSLVEDVYNQMEALLAHDRSMSLVLPVSELPKGGLVEIRAIGTTEDDGLYKPANAANASERLLQPGLHTQSVVCGKLGFVASTISESGSSGKPTNRTELIHSSIIMTAFETNPSPLSLQVYIPEAEELKLESCLETELTDLFPACAVCVLRSAWMPREATCISLATFSL